MTPDLVLLHLKGLMDANDRRYGERFDAQQHAVQVALAAVNSEFHEHLLQYRNETKAALDSADKAIAKAELATEKRFEGVNEFRAQLSDQSATFMPRLEAEQRMARNTDDIAALASRIDRTEGRSGGLSAGYGYLIAAIAAATAIFSAVVLLAR